MKLIWMLIGIVLVVVIYAARKIVRGWTHKLFAAGAAFASACYLPNDAFRASAPRKRQIKWISMKECESLVRGSDEVIFVAIRPSCERKVLSFAAMSVLSIPPNQLVDVLPGLPAGTSVVLLGEADLCTSIVESLDEMRGAIPIYALKEVSVRSRAV